MSVTNNPIGPTVPNDIKNETIMRAWYQAMWSSVRDLHNERISVTDYGAVGDGVTDDTTAFVTALAVADDQTKVLWIPQGSYRITSTITIANPVTILGEGMSVSTIEPYLGTSGGDVFLITSSDVTLGDFGFDGTSVGSITLVNDEFMVHVNPTSGTLNRLCFQNLKFSTLNFSAGTKSPSTISSIRSATCIKVEDTDQVCIENCHVDTVSGSFVYTTGVNYIDIRSNYIKDALITPVWIHDTTNYFNIVSNYFNPLSDVGVYLGGIIDVTSASGLQCRNGNIQNNFIRGFDEFSGAHGGYFSYGSLIHVSSSRYINISDNFMHSLSDGTINANYRLLGGFVEPCYIKIETYGTSSSDDNGPCSSITIHNNHMRNGRILTGGRLSGIAVSNNFQLSRKPLKNISIQGNIIHDLASANYLEYSTEYVNHHFAKGVVFHGYSSGIENISVENNTFTCAIKQNEDFTTGKGIVGFKSTDSTGKCSYIRIGGNHLKYLVNGENNGAFNPSSTNEACLVIGQYTSDVINTSPNILLNGYYGIIIETGAGSNLYYLDNQLIDVSGNPSAAGNTLFNVQPISYHTSVSGTTANRPTSTTGLTNYMTYFDTTLGTPMWYNGSSWINAWGDASTFAEAVSDQVGTMVTGNTETGITVTYQDSDNTLDFVVSDTTVAADSGSTALTPGDTLTVTGAGMITAVSGDTLTTSLDFSDLGTTDTSIGGADLISIHDGAQKKITWANAEASIDTVGTVTSGTWSATTIAVNKGGTGQTSYTDGQLLIGNTTGNTLTKASLTAGSNITITPGSGSITIAASISGTDEGIRRSWMGL